MMSSEDRLDEIFSGIWQEIRNARHIPGQPRNQASAHSVSLAQKALQLANDSQSEKLLLEAWQMMTHSLMADEQYSQAIPFYENRIQKLEQMGDFQRAAIARQGYVLA